MSLTHISPVVVITFEGDKIVRFKSFLKKGEDRLNADLCKGKIKSISLCYAFCGEQDYGIVKLIKAFNADNKKYLIKRIPIETEEVEGIKVIKYGEDATIPKDAIIITKKVGVTGYWDSSNFIICIDPQYNVLFESMKEFFKPRRIRFEFHSSFMGRCDLLFVKS